MFSHLNILINMHALFTMSLAPTSTKIYVGMYLLAVNDNDHAML